MKNLNFGLRILQKKIRLNLQLAKKPIDCLEYVILHELAHLKVKNHNEQFVAIMDQYMPYWREIRKKLNDQILDYMDSTESDIFQLFAYNAHEEGKCQFNQKK